MMRLETGNEIGSYNYSTNKGLGFWIRIEVYLGVARCELETMYYSCCIKSVFLPWVPALIIDSRKRVHAWWSFFKELRPLHFTLLHSRPDATFRGGNTRRSPALTVSIELFAYTRLMPRWCEEESRAPPPLKCVGRWLTPTISNSIYSSMEAPSSFHYTVLLLQFCSQSTKTWYTQ